MRFGSCNTEDQVWIRDQTARILHRYVLSGKHFRIDNDALLSRVLPRVATVHASDRHLENDGGTNRLVHGVVGQGLNDYDRIWTALKGARFSGWVSIEDGEGPTIEEGMRNLRDSVAFVRRLLDT